MGEMAGADGVAIEDQAHSRRTVLIVDDDDEVRHVLQLVCEMEGFEVFEARNGLEAVPMALHRQPAFVILDYRMPGRNGDVTAEMIRTIAPETKIVAFTAVLEEKPAWCDSFLNKERISEVAPLLQHLIY